MNNLELDFNKCLAGILGFVVGDALGVPAEFKSRNYLKDNPITEMIGYGTHGQPAGTWSDDTSMMLATLEWLSEMTTEDLNYSSLMDKFSRWLMYGEYTPYGEMFDCGISTSRAIMNYEKGISPLLCGGKTDWDNGNGSLMRILPGALWCSKGFAIGEMCDKQFIYELSSLTHAHMRSKIGCIIYSKVIADLFYAKKEDKVAIIERSMNFCRAYLDSADEKDVKVEKNRYHRLWEIRAFKELDESYIKSSGYVVDTLEAAVWCFLNTDNYEKCVLKAVNLGEDTDTVAAIAGSIAGLYYGIESIPQKWINLLPKKEWICMLTKRVVERRNLIYYK